MSEKNIDLEALNHLTQYANVDDQAFFRNFNNSLDDVTDFDNLNKLLVMMTQSDMKINDEIFTVIYHLTDEKVSFLIDLLEAYNSKNINEVLNLFKLEINQVYETGFVGYKDFFEEYADRDLKKNGIKSSTLKWAKSIPDTNDLLNLDVYDELLVISFDDFFDELISCGFTLESRIDWLF